MPRRLSARSSAASEGLRVLVTSRAPLHVSGEREYRLEPLARPTRQRALRRAGTGSRAGRRAGFDGRGDLPPPRRSPARGRARRRADEALAPEGSSSASTRRFPLLTGGARDAPERQRTLRATIEWSYDLLDAASRSSSRASPSSSAASSSRRPRRSCEADLDGLATLVDYSLLKPIGDDRFLMLETIREYALERLDELGGRRRAPERHADFFSALAEQAYGHRFEAEAEWSARLDADHDDLRAALDWLSPNDPDARARARRRARVVLAVARAAAEGTRQLAGRARGSPSDAVVLGRERCCIRRARRPGMAMPREDWRQLEEALALWRELGDRHELASALDSLGWPLSTTPATRPARWRRSRRASSSAASSATKPE